MPRKPSVAAPGPRRAHGPSPGSGQNIAGHSRAADGSPLPTGPRSAARAYPRARPCCGREVYCRPACAARYRRLAASGGRPARRAGRTARDRPRAQRRARRAGDAGGHQPHDRERDARGLVLHLPARQAAQVAVSQGQHRPGADRGRPRAAGAGRRHHRLCRAAGSARGRARCRTRPALQVPARNQRAQIQIAARRAAHQPGRGDRRHERADDHLPRLHAAADRAAVADRRAGGGRAGTRRAARQPEAPGAGAVDAVAGEQGRHRAHLLRRDAERGRGDGGADHVGAGHGAVPV